MPGNVKTPGSGSSDPGTGLVQQFSSMADADRIRVLQRMLEICSRVVLVETQNYIAPRLRHDPFKVLPAEISLRILSYIKDPRDLAAASQVSRLWYLLLSDDYTWKRLCEAHHFRRLSAAGSHVRDGSTSLPQLQSGVWPEETRHGAGLNSFHTISSSGEVVYTTNASTSDRPSPVRRSSAPPDMPTAPLAATVGDIQEVVYCPEALRKELPTSYRTHFRQQYLLNQAWCNGGRLAARYVLHNTENVIVTVVLLKENYVVVALDNSKILVFSSRGRLLQSLYGHVMGVWALALYGNTLVSGGCDRDVRVWNVSSGTCTRILQGHNSTVRCLGMKDEHTIVSGARDATLRVWDVNRGACLHVLEGHVASVRCVEVVQKEKDLCVSASYDCTAKVWRISTGELIYNLSGHVSQIYSLAVDGMIAATGSLDTTIRIWDLRTGACRNVLQGHIALVGQLQLRGNTLISGGSDGAIRVWDLSKTSNPCIHRIAAHDNSVTCLRFDDERIVSGGPDGRVHVWGLQSGKHIRTIGPRFQTVWGVAFREDRLVIVGSQNQNTVIELISFIPQ